MTSNREKAALWAAFIIYPLELRPRDFDDVVVLQYLTARRYRFVVDPRLAGPELRVQHVAIGAAVNSGRVLAGVVAQGFLFQEWHAFARVFSFHGDQLRMHRDDPGLLQRVGRGGARARAFAEPRRIQSKIITINQLVLTNDDRLAVPQFM